MPRKGRNAFLTTQTESELENKCRKYCEKFGFKLIKQTTENGIPDRFLIGKPIAPKLIPIEFKKPGGPLTLDPKQAAYHKILKKFKYEPLVINDYQVFKKLIDSLVLKHKIYKHGKK